ncbi:MAG: RagB/SusD family nutrient uptake outer membrane protein [Saprospiraceae bacterium]|nr:RagB/SusD family nutrient uptake outer membrane protein [Saprospiraceae bacterium]
MKSINYNIFKNKVLTIFAVLLMMTVVSCDKDVTEIQPFDRITESLAFSTPARVELSMVGVYDAAQSGFFAGGQVRGYPFGAANVQQGDMRGEDMLNVAAFYAITYEANYNTASANNVFMWHTLYGVINKANLIIDGVKAAVTNGVLTDAQAKAYEGEARFLRALSHHELLNHFSRPYGHTAGASHPGVPYRTVAVNSSATLTSEVAKGRNTVAECYTLLLEDLNFAEQNLPATRTGGLRISRATKGAAIALKMRVQLHKGDFPAVITEGNKLLVDKVGNHSLTASPEGVFASNNTNTESIFSIENFSTDNPGVNGALPAMYAVAPGRALVAISPIMYNNPLWLQSDLRRSLLTSEAGNGFFSNKYRRVATQEDWNPIIRLAEVYLSVAEAYARAGNTTAALAHLNAVRNRAVTDPADQFTDGSFSDAKALLGAILMERRIELLGEGRRWHDIHRLALDPDFSTGGIPSKVAFGNVTKASWGFGLNHDGITYSGSRTIIARPYDDFRFLWPIPQDELNTNEVLREQQNPGY